MIDSEKKVSHSSASSLGCLLSIHDCIDISRDTQALFEAPERISKKLSPLLVTSCYLPSVQSGGKYKLTSDAGSDTKMLSFDNIICSLGARYKVESCFFLS